MTNKLFWGKKTRDFVIIILRFITAWYQIGLTVSYLMEFGEMQELVTRRIEWQQEVNKMTVKLSTCESFKGRDNEDNHDDDRSTHQGLHGQEALFGRLGDCGQRVLQAVFRVWPQRKYWPPFIQLSQKLYKKHSFNLCSY